MNEEQIDYWNGPAGERWTREQKALDRALEPFGRAVLARARALVGERVLDIGCGSGALLLALADAVGESGHVTGVDVSSPMLAAALKRSKDRSNVSLIQADATTHKLDGAADLIASRFGVMFFADPVVAFQNLRAALRPGGRIAFACWRAPAENPWINIPQAVTLEHVAAPPPKSPEDPGPFAFADHARIERILGASGFGEITIEAFDTDVVLSIDGLESAVDFAIVAGMAARLLANADEDTVRRVREGLRLKLAPHCRQDRVTLGGAAWIASAIA